MEKELTFKDIYSELQKYPAADWLIKLFDEYRGIPGYECENNIQLEWHGDLQEIEDAIARHILTVNEPTPELRGIGHMWEFIKAAEMVTNPNELKKIPNIINFQRKYPNLYHTFCTWAWG